MSLGALSPAMGQSGSPTLPSNIAPLQVEPDRNGVNLTTGLMRVDVPKLSTPAAPRLSFDLLQNAMPHLVAKFGGSPGSYVESSISVHSGAASSAAFRCIYDDYCYDIKQTGAVIEGAVVTGGTYYYTEPQSGAYYTFDRLEYDNGPASPSRQVQYYASSIVYPDGETISFTYETTPYGGRTLYRLTRMSSNIGFYISFSYQSNDTSQNSWRYLAQATLYNASAPSTPIGQLTYSGDQITDLAGRSFTCTGCVNAPGSPVEWPAYSGTYVALTLPTEGSVHLQATSNLSPVTGISPPPVTSITRDGVGWSYSYSNYRTAPAPANYTYDYVQVAGPNSFSQRYNILAPANDRPNLVSSVVDSIGRTTSYDYDSNFRPIKVTKPEGATSRSATTPMATSRPRPADPSPGRDKRRLARAPRSTRRPATRPGCSAIGSRLIPTGSAARRPLPMTCSVVWSRRRARPTARASSACAI
jgi:hypothetical protein